jgi:DNA-damage-inducible protein J
MSAVQIATRVDEEQGKKFRAITAALGTTPADALRMFIVTFNARGGFPYETRLDSQEIEAFATESEATEFATRLSKRIISETR